MAVSFRKAKDYRPFLCVIFEEWPATRSEKPSIDKLRLITLRFFIFFPSKSYSLIEKEENKRNPFILTSFDARCDRRESVPPVVVRNSFWLFYFYCSLLWSFYCHYFTGVSFAVLLNNLFVFLFFSLFLFLFLFLSLSFRSSCSFKNHLIASSRTINVSYH